MLRTKSYNRRSPQPKKRNHSSRDEPAPPPRPKRYIYPRDYETQQVKNDCAFCGRNHYSDNCGAVDTSEEREAALDRNGRCRTCVSLKRLGHNNNCGREQCRYCQRSTDHHYTICSHPRHEFTLPWDYQSPTPRSYRERQRDDSRDARHHPKEQSRHGTRRH
uniref:Uncharacterized protein n=1 Tax=Caenorhabditis japonica TaxID=281687 RepID=A0A8R1HY04_CAEJA